MHTNEPTEADDDCDGFDDDCDGAVDEHYVAPDTTCGEGVCARTGKMFCFMGSTYDSCTPLEPAEDDSDCNGKDDDCDGLIEDYVPEITTCGTGGCANEGLSSCVDGKVESSCVALPPAADDAT